MVLFVAAHGTKIGFVMAVSHLKSGPRVATKGRRRRCR